MKSLDFRTKQQNRALHLMFTQTASQLNESGLEMRKVLAIKEVDVPWNQVLVKEVIWRPLQKAVIGKKSTTELTTTEIDKVFVLLSKVFAERLGIEIEFPSIETLMAKQKGWDRENRAKGKVPRQ